MLYTIYVDRKPVAKLAGKWVADMVFEQYKRLLPERTVELRRGAYWLRGTGLSAV